MASKGDLLIYQGDDYRATVTLSNQDGSPVDLTGFTAQAQIREDVADVAPDVLVEIGTTLGTSAVELSIPNAQTKLLNGTYRWDLQLTSADGFITTVLAGKVTATAEVTRSAAA